MRSMRLLVAFCIALFAAAAHAESAGQVLFAYGETLALRAGHIVRLMAGAPIESGDQIHTGAESYLQIRFTDWGVMSLRPRTDFVVEDYAYEQGQGGRERAFFVLLRGGLRSLTGLIGHGDRSHYRLRTRTAYIGIRGTHYSVLMCEHNCTNADGSLGEDGLYGGVIEGRIAVGPYGGTALEREFGAGEYFRLESANAIPMPVFTPPSFFWDKLEPQARSGGKTFAGIPWKPAPAAPGAPSDPLGPVASDPTGTAGSLLRTDGSLTLSPITAPLLNPVTVSVGSTVGSVTAPVASLVGSTVGSVVNPVLAPVTSTVGSSVGSLVNPVVAPLASAVGSTVGSVANPILAPITPAIGSTVSTVVNPVLAPVTPVIGSTVGSVVTPVLAPVAPVIGSTVTPVVAPVAPVIAPIASVVAPVITPVAPAITPVAPVIAPVIAPIAPVIAPVIAPIAPVIAPIAPVIAPIAPVAPVTPVIAPPVNTVTLPTLPSLPVLGGLPSLLPKK